MARSSERKPPSSDPSLEPRVQELEHQVAALTEQVELLEGRVEDLEDQPPIEPPIEPPVEPPIEPPVEPPPAGSGEDVIKDGMTLSQLCAAGGTVDLPAGTFHGTTSIAIETTVTGQDTVLTCEGLEAAAGKGMFAASAKLTLRGLRIVDVSVPDMNGAAVRTEPDISLVMEDCGVERCQNGILTAWGSGTVTLTRCNFHGNGAGDGKTHEIYIGEIAALTATGSEFVCGARSTHAVKSRAKATTIKDCRLVGSPDTSGYTAGSTLDICNGGEVLIENTVIEGSPGHSQLFGYAMEGTSQGVGTVTLRGVTVVDRRGSGGQIQSAAGGALVLESCTYEGPNPPQILGWTSVQGQFSAAVRGRAGQPG